MEEAVRGGTGYPRTQPVFLTQRYLISEPPSAKGDLEVPGRHLHLRICLSWVSPVPPFFQYFGLNPGPKNDSAVVIH